MTTKANMQAYFSLTELARLVEGIHELLARHHALRARSEATQIKIHQLGLAHRGANAGLPGHGATSGLGIGGHRAACTSGGPCASGGLENVAQRMRMSCKTM